jgi:hypothetical protein
VLLPFDGNTGPTPLAPTQGNVLGIVADAANAYVADATGTWRTPLSGGPPTALTARAGTLGLFGDDLVIADAVASEILTVPARGGALTTLASGQPQALDPVACGDALCWMTVGDVMRGQGVASIVRFAAPAAPATIASGADLFSPTRLAFDSDAFFVAIGVDTLPSGPIEQVPATGGPPTPVADATTVGFALDDHCIYWTDPANGVFAALVRH